MKRYLIIFLVPAILFVLISCSRDTYFKNPGTDVEIYLVKSFETEDGTDQIITSSVVIEDEPLVTYDQILEYNVMEYTFKVSQDAIESINEEGGLRCHFKTFAITVDREVIYAGYFWPSYSSSIKMWFVIDPLFLSSEQKLRVQKAYPSNSFAGNYPDLRNDPRIIAVFSRDNKLR
jgi:hypothetical protein